MRARYFLTSGAVAVVLLAGVFATAAGCSGAAESNGGDGDGGGATSTTTSSGGGQGGQGGEACVPETETCDGLDNNCDGQADEGCGPCDSGATQACYTGRPVDTAGKGLCHGGTQTCDTTGNWGPCNDEVVPAAETCDKLDNDCNDAVDDGIADLECGEGACKVTVAGCDNGSVPTCVPNQPTAEVCDGVDNDCDQLTDEADPNVGAVCTSAVPGICSAGTTLCLMGALTCMPDLLPVVEICDDLDNDCNGMVDDAIVGTGGDCSTGLNGVCFNGKIQCQGGVIDCFSIIPPSAEVCDTLDNNCDGAVDEGNPEGGASCPTGQLGVCATGTVTCQSGALNCVPNAIGSAETCNGLDDNCDGQADEGNPGGGGACGCGGTFQCMNAAVVCQGGPLTYFFDDFSGGNSKGWTLGTNWGIGTAAASSGHNYGNPDPSSDHSPTADNKLAGVVIGGNAPTALNPNSGATYYYMESPVIDTSAAPGTAGSLYINLWRFLNSDYTPYMQNDIEVFNGSTWIVVWASSSSGIVDTAWQGLSYDISSYKNAAMKIRIGYRVGSSGVYTVSQWNIDDVSVSSAACP